MFNNSFLRTQCSNYTIPKLKPLKSAKNKLKALKGQLNQFSELNEHQEEVKPFIVTSYSIYSKNLKGLPANAAVLREKIKPAPLNLTEIQHKKPRKQQLHPFNQYINKIDLSSIHKLNRMPSEPKQEREGHNTLIRVSYNKIQIKKSNATTLSYTDNNYHESIVNSEDTEMNDLEFIRQTTSQIETFRSKINKREQNNFLLSSFIKRGFLSHKANSQLASIPGSTSRTLLPEAKSIFADTIYTTSDSTANSKIVNLATTTNPQNLKRFSTKVKLKANDINLTKFSKRVNDLKIHCQVIS